MAIKLDVTDRRILYELEQNCKRSLNEITKRVRASKQTLHYRIERLVREGAITQFIAIVNTAKLGLVNHEVWIELEAIPEERRKAFMDFLIRHKHTRWVASCGGKMDIAIAIVAENIVQFNAIWQDILNKYHECIKGYFLNVTPEYFTYPRTHLIGEKENRFFSHLGGEPELVSLDEIELGVLNLLSKDARLPIVEIAKKLEVTENTIRAKIKRLEKDKIIQTYAAIIQPTALGLVHFEILATTRNMTKEHEKALETYCLLNPYVTYYLRMVGKFDIDIAFDANNNGHFQDIIIEFRSRFSDIIKEFEFVYIIKHEKFDYFAGMRR